MLASNSKSNWSGRHTKEFSMLSIEGCDKIGRPAIEKQLIKALQWRVVDG
jgi:hypothetical protein